MATDKKKQTERDALLRIQPIISPEMQDALLKLTLTAEQINRAMQPAPWVYEYIEQIERVAAPFAVAAENAERLSRAMQRPTIWPGPKIEPTAAPQQLERVGQRDPDLFDLVEQALKNGEVDPADMIRLLAGHTQAKPGPKQDNSEWTEAQVMTMWLDWQENKHKLTADAQAERWNTSKSSMYRHFKDYGL